MAFLHSLNRKCVACLLERVRAFAEQCCRRTRADVVMDSRVYADVVAARIVRLLGIYKIKTVSFKDLLKSIHGEQSADSSTQLNLSSLSCSTHLDKLRDINSCVIQNSCELNMEPIRLQKLSAANALSFSTLIPLCHTIHFYVCSSRD
jgi:hypothetical protein